MTKFYFIVLTCFTAAFITCKPYNSTEKNKELIQGRWILKSIDYRGLGIDSVNIPGDTVHVFFGRDSVIEKANEVIIRESSFDIKGYNLTLHEKDGNNLKFSITSLNDSVFTMRGVKSKAIWRYEK